MMNDIITKENVKYMIYEIRGKHVMLSSDIAKLYQVETKRINEVVKRNIERFPDNFCFQLTNKEYRSICSRSQVATLNKSNNKRGTNLKYLPYVFTEHGIMMLSGLLKSDIAVKINVLIINAFVEMKNYISMDLMEQQYYKKLILNHEEKLKEIHYALKKLETKELTKKIYFEGEIYDAYSKLIDIMNSAFEELIIIDNYADKNVLDMISKIKINVTIIKKEKGLLKTIDIKKYNEQYHNLKIVYSNIFHDRFLIIDKNRIYHLGSSLNHAGKKLFCINRLEDDDMVNALITKVNKIFDLKKCK